MIKLKRLIENAEPTDSDQWDDWYDYIKYFEYDIEKVEIAKLIKRFNLSWDGYFNNTVVKIQDRYLTHDKDAETFSLIKDIEQWVYDLSDSNYRDLGINPEDMYNGHIESTLKDLKKNPGKVYHWTTEEKWEEIQLDKQMVGSYGTGINNRGAHGIFTSANAEEYQLGSYGNICLELDLDKFKIESGITELDLAFEPEVEEFLMREHVRYALHLDSREDVSGDISPSTVVVSYIIPIKYIRQI